MASLPLGGGGSPAQHWRPSLRSVSLLLTHIPAPGIPGYCFSACAHIFTLLHLCLHHFFGPESRSPLPTLETLPFFQGMVRKSPAPGSPLQSSQVGCISPSLVFAAGMLPLTPCLVLYSTGSTPWVGQLLKLGKGLTQLCFPLSIYQSNLHTAEAQSTSAD